MAQIMTGSNGFTGGVFGAEFRVWAEMTDSRTSQTPSNNNNNYYYCYYSYYYHHYCYYCHYYSSITIILSNTSNQK